MTKSDVVKALRRTSGSEFISRKELASALGYRDSHSVDKYLVGLAKVGRRYYIEDVAERVTEERK